MSYGNRQQPRDSGVRRRLNGLLWLSAVATVLALGACANDRNRGYTNHPDRWEYRQSPSDNYGRIYRY